MLRDYLDDYPMLPRCLVDYASWTATTPATDALVSRSVLIRPIAVTAGVRRLMALCS